MTIIQAISGVDGLQSNMIPEEVKIALLSELDGKIYYDVMYPYASPGDFVGYDGQTPTDTELLAPYPYDSLYTAYLAQEIHRINGETVKYNNASTVFNEKYSTFLRWYTRTHSYDTPKIKIPMRRY